MQKPKIRVTAPSRKQGHSSAAQIAGDAASDPAPQFLVEQKLIASRKLMIEALQLIPPSRSKATAIMYFDTAILWLNDALNSWPSSQGE